MDVDDVKGGADEMSTERRVMRCALFLVPRETSRNPFLEEVRRCREGAASGGDGPDRTMSMHWWGKACGGTIHATVTSFARVTSEEDVRRISEAVRAVLVGDVEKTSRREFRVTDPRLPRADVRKRRDAAAIVFEAADVEAFLGRFVEKLRASDVGADVRERVNAAIERRREVWRKHSSVPTKSMTLLATDTNERGTRTSGRSVDDLLTGALAKGLLAQCLRSRKQDEDAEMLNSRDDWRYWFRMLRWDIAVVSCDEVDYQRRTPWKSWCVRVRVPF